jgi:putative toxin-antitoxin system antitoxin component (TIGR02293 family)
MLETTAFSRTLDLLGGIPAFGHVPQTRLDVHAVIQAGFPGDVLTRLVDNVPLMANPAALDRAIGVGLRTLQRRRQAAAKTRLSPAQSARAWKFAEVLAKATALFGSQADAEAWLDRPALGLDQQRPIDLLSTPVGTELVEQFIDRLEAGVYA